MLARMDLNHGFFSVSPGSIPLILAHLDSVNKHTYQHNNSLKAEAGRLLEVQSQPRPQKKTMSQKRERKPYGESDDICKPIC